MGGIRHRPEGESKKAGWHARLAADLKLCNGRTVLGRTQRSGPLTVQQPFYPEGGVCHLYLLHPPGGLVGGDRLDLELRLDPDAAAVVTTPGATKFYRTAGRDAVQNQAFFLAPRACLEWFPQETILFDRSMARLSTRVDLTPESVFMGWEILCLGQPALERRFEPGALSAGLAVWQDGRPLFLDRLNLTCDREMDNAAGMRGCSVTATYLAAPVSPDLLALVRTSVEHEDALMGITLLDNLMVARYLGDDPNTARRIFMDIHRVIRPEIAGRPLCLPRIWNT